MHQLLVRIYPEPLAVDTHEEDLTETERSDGADFWTETAAAASNDELRKGAWRALCIGRSTQAGRVDRPRHRTGRPRQTGPPLGARRRQAINDAITAIGETAGRPRRAGSGRSCSR